MQEIVSHKNVTITVDTRVIINIKIEACKLDILVINAKRKEILILEIGITSQLIKVEKETKRKYDVLANYRSQPYNIKVRIIPWAMIWDGIVTKTHKQYLKELRKPIKHTRNIQL